MDDTWKLLFTGAVDHLVSMDGSPRSPSSSPPLRRTPASCSPSRRSSAKPRRS
jgi:hypothetical protein